MKYLSLLFLFLALPLLLMAQPGFQSTFTDLPIDGGISALLVAGVGYGVKKLYGVKANKNTKDIK